MRTSTHLLHITTLKCYNVILKFYSQAVDTDPKHQVTAKVASYSVSKIPSYYYAYMMQRSVSTFPITKCNSNNEGDIAYNPVDPSTVWLCKSSVWKPHK